MPGTETGPKVTMMKTRGLCTVEHVIYNSSDLPGHDRATRALGRQRLPLPLSQGRLLFEDLGPTSSVCVCLWVVGLPHKKQFPGPQLGAAQFNSDTI